MTRNKKGFTLVELVIVIAVIAILAGVMIAVFSGVVKRANESAELQKLKNEELAQKADDVIKKIDNANWFSWEDFENSLAAKMTEVYKANTANSETTSIDDIKVAVKAALKEYTESNATQNTQLTEAQVKAIVENALADARLGGVTETQVRTIVNTAVAGIQSPLTKTQVQAIVDAAVAKGLTAAQVAQVIGEQGLATSAQIQTVIATLNTISTNALSKEDVEDALLKLLPVTYSVSNQTELEAALAKVNSFSTLSFTSDFAATITLGASDTRTLTLTGVKLTSLTVNAPVATIYLVTDAGTVKVNSVAQQSFHVSGKVDSLTIGQGRAVVEEGGEVTSLTAAPAENQVVKVEIAQAAKVETLTVELQKNEGAKETVEIANAGTVETTTVVAETGNAAVSTNVVISGYTAAEVKEVADATTTAGATILDTDAAVEYTTQTGTTAASTQEHVDTTVKLQGTGTEADPYLVRTVEELKLVAANVNGGETGKYYKLTADLDISDMTWTPIGDKEENQFVGTFDGGKHTITGLNNRASFEYVGTEVITVTTGKKVNVYGLFGWVTGTSTVKDLTMADVSLSLNNGSGVGAVAGYVGAFTTGVDVTFSGITVTGKITAFDNAAGVAGRNLYSKSDKPASGTVTFTNCTNEATVTVTRTADGYARAGGIAAYLQSDTDCSFVFTNCTNTATITGRQGNTTEQWVGQIYGYESGKKGTITATGSKESGDVVIVNAVA